MAELGFLRDNGPRGNPFRNDRRSVQAAFLRRRDDQAGLREGRARTCDALSRADVRSQQSWPATENAAERFRQPGASERA